MKTNSFLERLVQRYLRSRFLSVITLLLIFSVWIATAGYLLWECRIATTYTVQGELLHIDDPGDSDKGVEGPESFLLRGVTQKDFPLLSAGGSIEVRYLSQDNKELFQLDAQVIRHQQEDTKIQVVIKIATDTEKEQDMLLRNCIPADGNFTVVVRNKRLLVAAFGSTRKNVK